MNLFATADAYRRHALIGTLLCLGLLAVLTVLVATGATDSLDVWAREQFRPDLMWGEDQQRANHVVYWLGPSRILVLMVLGSLGVSIWRLSLWPLVQSGLVVAATAGLVVVLKFLVDRGDPTGQHSGVGGGSFPSGHSAVLLACVATGAMLVSCPTRWWQRAGFLLMEAALALAMLYVALHWLTDIVGGALVAGVVLGVEALVAGPDGGPSHRNRWRRRSRPQDRSPDSSTV